MVIEEVFEFTSFSISIFRKTAWLVGTFLGFLNFTITTGHMFDTNYG